MQLTASIKHRKKVCAYEKMCAYKKGALNNPSLLSSSNFPLYYIPHYVINVGYLQYHISLNCFRTGCLAQAERNKSCSGIVSAPCVRDYLGGHSSTFNCSIAQVLPQRAAKLCEIATYDRSTVQCGCIRSICHDQVQI